MNYLKTNKAIRHLNESDIVAGKVIRRTAREIFFDLGIYGIGRLYGREYLSSHDSAKKLKEGDDVMVKIIGVGENEDYEVTLRGTMDLDKWQKVTKAMQDKEVLELDVKQVNWGGLIVELEGLSGFVPLSHLSVGHYPRVEGGNKNLIVQELQKLLNQKIKLRVIDVDPRSQKLILSERAAEEANLKALIAQYKVGDVVDGEISGLTKFGAFFAFGNPTLEGLIHISEISHTPVNDPNEVLKVHEAKKAKIIKIENDRIFLSLKELEKNPVAEFLEENPVGKQIKVTVLEVSPEMVKVKVASGVFGLIEGAPQDAAPNQEVSVKIAGTDKGMLILKKE